MATMRDVARKANVSVATVSFVVNSSRTVSTSTRKKVEAAMRELKFQPNPMGRALAAQQTKIIGLLVPHAKESLSWNSVQALIGTTITAKELGYNVMLFPSTNEMCQVTDLTSSGLIAGVVVFEVQLNDHRVEELRKTDTPFVLFGGSRNQPNVTYVDIDFDQALLDSVHHLNSLGHRNIAFLESSITGNQPADPYLTTRRHERCIAELRHRGLTVKRFSCAPDTSGGHLAAAKILESLPTTTALIVQNERSLGGLLSGLYGTGCKIPKDLSILVVDSSFRGASLVDPELTAMASNGVAMGRLGVTALIDQIQGKLRTTGPILVPCELRGGSSTAPPTGAVPHSTVAST